MTRRIDCKGVSPARLRTAVDAAVRLLREGKVVAIPTDTVYGLAVDPTSESALEALFAAKGRPDNRPIALLAADPSAIRSFCPSPSPIALALMQEFWPGPLTLVLPANCNLHAPLRGPGGAFGIRMPDHPVTLALLRAWGAPLAVTSANRSGKPDRLEAMEVEREMGGSVALILDAGRAPGGSPSTVVDLTAVPFRILREGPITEDQLRACAATAEEMPNDRNGAIAGKEENR